MEREASLILGTLYTRNPLWEIAAIRLEGLMKVDIAEVVDDKQHKQESALEDVKSMALGV